MTFSLAMQEYENYMRNILGRSENTIRNYMHDLQQLREWHGSESLSLSKQELESYLSELAEKKLSAATRSRKVTAFQVFFSFLYENGLISENPSLSLRKPKIPQKEAKVMSAEEMREVILTAKNDSKGVDYFRNLTLISLLFATGLRRNEIINIKLSDVDTSENALLVREGKGNKQRVVYYNDETKALLSEYIASHRSLLKYSKKSEYLFVSNCNEKLGLSTVNDIVNKLYEKAGIKEKGYVLHSTRKAFATNVYKSTHDIFAVQHLLGHSSPQTTMRYVGIEEEAKKNAAKTISF